MRIGSVTSTGASRLLSFSSTDLQTRADASAADVQVGQAGLRQRCTNQAHSRGAEVPVTQQIMERFLSIWLMRPLGGGRVVVALRMGLLKMGVH